MSALYRRNAGIVVFNSRKEVLLCRRNDVAKAWQFPQGGIEAGETPQQAALRELKEETSITSVEWVTTLAAPIRYDFPPEVRRKMLAQGIAHAGQEMYWTLVYFRGDDEEIRLDTPEPEFSSYRWGSLEEACTEIVDFKKAAYAYAAAAFKPLIEQYLPG